MRIGDLIWVEVKSAGQAIYVVVLGDPLEGIARSFQLSESSVTKGQQVYLCGAAFDKVRQACLVLHPLSHRYKVSKAALTAAEKARAWQFGKRKH